MLNETTALMNAYAQAASYQTAPTFTNYQVSGDATDWLAKLDIPAITVALCSMFYHYLQILTGHYQFLHKQYLYSQGQQQVHGLYHKIPHFPNGALHLLT